MEMARRSSTAAASNIIGAYRSGLKLFTRTVIRSARSSGDSTKRSCCRKFDEHAFPVFMKAIVLLLMAVGLAGTSFAEPPAAFEIVVDPKNSVEGNDAEALYDEMNRVELRQALAESCDLKPELGLAINWTVGSGKSGFTIALLPPEGVSAADAEKLLNVIRKYVELRRVGLTKDFIVPRLKSPQPAAGGAPANSPLAMAQSFLPGATEKDFQQIDRRIASFPL